jgi:two-component system KDP operon response regulator KdpE
VIAPDHGVYVILNRRLWAGTAEIHLGSLIVIAGGTAVPVTILVVDHEVGIRHLLAAVLGDVGYHVISARNSDAAIAIVESQTVHLIVTAIQTPTVDGRDFFRTLAERDSSVPVVVMTSSNAAEIARDVGAVGYLDKPFTVFQARATITAALQRTGAQPPVFVRTEQERALRVFVYTSQRFLAEMITLTLDHGVYATRAGHNVTEAATIIRDWHPHLVVVDLDSDGGELLNQVGLDRAAGTLPIPIIAVTRHRDLRTMLAAFDQGVDDVLTVPISPEELLARVLAITRRTYGQSFPLKPILVLGQLEIDIVNHRVRVGSSEVHLTETEQSLLYLLAANAGEVVTSEEILAAVWGADYTEENDVVERLIVSLRQKLQNGWPEPRFIVTFPGFGYRFLPMVEQLESVS